MSTLISSNKILSSKRELFILCQKMRDENKKITLCQGHFNMIHPGHIRFLEFARKHGDVLIVAIHGNKMIEDTVRNEFYSAEERTVGVAMLSIVDQVFIVEEDNLDETVKIIRPNYFILGAEFKDVAEKDIRIKDSINIIKECEGEIIYSSGDIRYSSLEFYEKKVDDLEKERKMLFRSILQKHNINNISLQNLCKKFNKLPVMVIGDSIVDQYCLCDPLGMSSEAPVIVLKELERKSYVGGAAIVAKNIHGLSANPIFISVVGSDIEGKYLKNVLSSADIDSKIVIDNSRPTTLKTRFVVDNQKLLRISRLEEKYLNEKIENKIIKEIRENIRRVNTVVISDFTYGLFTQNIIEEIINLSIKFKIKILTDSQSSSQIGDLFKFKNSFLITPTEKEARLAINDKYSGLEMLGKKLLDKSESENLFLKLGANGFIVFSKTENKFFIQTEHFPALNPNPLDVVGAGDSLLSALAVSLAADASIMEAAAIAAMVASVSVGKIGNLAVNLNEVLKMIS
ncbi:MAG: adenylyltransferase/cytidyltransferase family protein [Oligoflexia bacterium]|nr:adenylyltransferase/cytidyltransferase family protein [Oligoflexia bacterium]